MAARCTIDGVEVPLTRVAKRVMNFGQSVPSREPLPYSIVVPRDEFLATLAAADQRTRQELIDDGESARPPLAELPPQLADEYVRTFLTIELLDALATSPVLDAEFQLNSLDAVIIDREIVELRGHCLRS